ncbi:MAG: HAD family hydrolase [Candidatus Magnetomorum sp.]|nr:HAD family hydrolase [Candidatus Magnetomorum sp.]
MKKYTLIIFDCDGVMFDTRSVNRLYYNHMLSHFHLPEMTDEQFEYSHSHSVFDAVRYLMAPHHIPETEVITYLKNINYSKYISHMIINPELKPLITAIRPPCLTAIATNRSDTMPKVLEKFELESFFDRVMTTLDVAKPKPDPEMIIDIINHFNIAPHHVLYIGDSQVDEQAAIQANVPFAAFQNNSLKADYHINALLEINPLISG